MLWLGVEAGLGPISGGQLSLPGSVFVQSPRAIPQRPCGIDRQPDNMGSLPLHRLCLPPASACCTPGHELAKYRSAVARDAKTSSDKDCNGVGKLEPCALEHPEKEFVNPVRVVCATNQGRLLPGWSTIAEYLGEIVVRHPVIAHSGTRAKAISREELVRVLQDLCSDNPAATINETVKTKLKDLLDACVPDGARGHGFGSSKLDTAERQRRDQLRVMRWP
jgi:hypothetical protein